LAEIKRVATQAAGTASYFLMTNSDSVKITIHITVQNRDRYEMIYDTRQGVTDEHEF
jgi:hypothetical protein